LRGKRKKVLIFAGSRSKRRVAWYLTRRRRRSSPVLRGLMQPSPLSERAIDRERMSR